MNETAPPPHPVIDSQPQQQLASHMQRMDMGTRLPPPPAAPAAPAATSAHQQIPPHLAEHIRESLARLSPTTFFRGSLLPRLAADLRQLLRTTLAKQGISDELGLLVEEVADALEAGAEGPSSRGGRSARTAAPSAFQLAVLATAQPMLGFVEECFQTMWDSIFVHDAKLASPERTAELCRALFERAQPGAWTGKWRTALVALDFGAPVADEERILGLVLDLVVTRILQHRAQHVLGLTVQGRRPVRDGLALTHGVLASREALARQLCDYVLALQMSIFHHELAAADDSISASALQRVRNKELMLNTLLNLATAGSDEDEVGAAAAHHHQHQQQHHQHQHHQPMSTASQATTAAPASPEGTEPSAPCSPAAADAASTLLSAKSQHMAPSEAAAAAAATTTDAAGRTASASCGGRSVAAAMRRRERPPSATELRTHPDMHLFALQLDSYLSPYVRIAARRPGAAPALEREATMHLIKHSKVLRLWRQVMRVATPRSLDRLPRVAELRLLIDFVHRFFRIRLQHRACIGKLRHRLVGPAHPRGPAAASKARTPLSRCSELHHLMAMDQQHHASASVVAMESEA